MQNYPLLTPTLIMSGSVIHPNYINECAWIDNGQMSIKRDGFTLLQIPSLFVQDRVLSDFNWLYVRVIDLGQQRPMSYDKF
ncbi:hypothetical protein EVAR_63134_1 [Eumeta japonica]|uniref:Uncharacterized protein n=1 Tax=Eumeta variegata TaxID=151549 RepID=A0A4C2AAH3_EUMVA|nr:hypothetical protein EVAR_63134_1 [Eumeta japonica]